MNRETEMMHAAIKILSNRAEQYEYSDYLMHATKDEVEEKKNRMLNQSKWERNRRNAKFMGDADLQAELGKHGYVNSIQGKISKTKANGYTNVPNDEKKKVLDIVQNCVNDIEYKKISTFVNEHRDFYPDATRQEIAKGYVEDRIIDDLRWYAKSKDMANAYMSRYANDIDSIITKKIRGI
ncbi:MAG: hypothetical protein J6U54_14210 [Clostridiales bacterium]|nr:hypothetical protein [Clostridiales bacterium]